MAQITQMKSKEELFYQRHHLHQRLSAVQTINKKESEMPDYKHSDLTRKVIGCAMTVHNTLGNGFQEVIYQRALAIELEKAGIAHRREQEMTIFYDGHEIGSR